MNVLILLIAVVTAGAQSAPWNFPRSAEYPNRYEGLIPRQVANPDFELLSFTGSRSSFRGSGELQVDFFLPSALPVLVRAQELRDDTYYRMASKPAAWAPGRWNTFGPWPIAAVIGPNEVARDNLGVVVFLSSAQDTSGEIAPAFVHDGTRLESPHYTLVFKTRSSLRQVHYALRRADAVADIWSGTADGDFIRGTPVHLDVPATELKEGPYTLEIRCIPVSGGASSIERRFTFHHPKPWPGPA